MKLLSGVLLIAVLLSVGVGACGGSGDVGKRASLASHRTSAATRNEAAVQAQLDNGSARGYMSDRDEDPGGIQENRGYHDGDDNSLSFSTHVQVANAAEARTIATLLNRYYAAAAADDGTRACPMLPASLVFAMPLDLGKLGPSYLHGAKTCPAIMTRIFKHERRDWTSGAVITGILLLNADHAAAMIGSAKLPASYIVLKREDGAWKIASPVSHGME